MGLGFQRCLVALANVTAILRGRHDNLKAGMLDFLNGSQDSAAGSQKPAVSIIQRSGSLRKSSIASRMGLAIYN